MVLRDGTTLRLRPPTAPTPTRCSSSSRPLAAQPLPALPRHPASRPALVEPFLESDWEERGARSGSLVGTARSGSSLSRATCGCATRPPPRRVRRRRRLQQRGHRDPAARAARRARRPAGIEHFVAEVLADNRPCSASSRRRLRGDARARGRRDRGRLPDRRTAQFERRVDGARSRRRRARRSRRSSSRDGRRRSARRARRGTIGGELFRNVARGGLRGRRLSGQPRRRARRRRPRLQVDRRDPRARRPRGHLRARRRRARRRREALARGVRALVRHLRRVRRGRAEGANASSACSRSCARTARGCSARTASASPSPAAA